MKQITFIHIVLCLFIFAFFFVPAVVDVQIPLLEELRLKSLDMRFKIRGGRKPSGNIVIAGIESKGTTKPSTTTILLNGLSSVILCVEN